MMDIPLAFFFEMALLMLIVCPKIHPMDVRVLPAW